MMSEQLVAEVDRHQLAAEAAAMQARPLRHDIGLRHTLMQHALHVWQVPI